MIGWYLGIFGIFIGLAGGIFFIKSLNKMEGNLKQSIFYLVAASIVYVVFSAIMVVLGLLDNTDFSSLTWQIVPILFTISAVLFVIGSMDLVKMLEGVSAKK